MKRPRQEYQLGDRVVLRDNTTATGTITSTHPRGPAHDEYFVRFDDAHHYRERLVRARDLLRAEVAR